MIANDHCPDHINKCQQCLKLGNDNHDLRAELEQVKKERDFNKTWASGVEEKLDRAIEFHKGVAERKIALIQSKFDTLLKKNDSLIEWAGRDINDLINDRDSKIDKLLAKIQQQDDNYEITSKQNLKLFAQRDKAVEFALFVLDFERGLGLDMIDVSEKALELGLLKQVIATNEDAENINECEEGSTIFKYTDILFAEVKEPTQKPEEKEDA